MNFGFNSNRRVCTLRLTVETASPQKIHLTVKNAYKPFTVYEDRYMTIKGKSYFDVNMPQSPDKCIVQLYNEANGNFPKATDDRSFKLLDKQVGDLKAKFTVQSLSRNVRGFVQFAQEFCENAGILSAGQSVYISDDNQFRIDYVDVIRDRVTGAAKTTPSRVSAQSGIIEVSKYHYKNYTVPMRMAILLHEYAHFYINKDISNETEADLNALLIYLGLGYPKIEAMKAWLQVFISAPSDGNVLRKQKIEYYINNFDSLNIKPL